MPRRSARPTASARRSGRARQSGDYAMRDEPSVLKPTKATVAFRDALLQRAAAADHAFAAHDDLLATWRKSLAAHASRAVEAHLTSVKVSRAGAFVLARDLDEIRKGAAPLGSNEADARLGRLREGVGVFELDAEQLAYVALKPGGAFASLPRDEQVRRILRRADAWNFRGKRAKWVEGGGEPGGELGGVVVLWCKGRRRRLRESEWLTSIPKSRETGHGLAPACRCGCGHEPCCPPASSARSRASRGCWGPEAAAQQVPTNQQRTPRLIAGPRTDDVHPIGQSQWNGPIVDEGITEDLRKLQSLLDDGVITEAEFTEKKRQLLDQPALRARARREVGRRRPQED